MCVSAAAAERIRARPYHFLTEHRYRITSAPAVVLETAVIRGSTAHRAQVHQYALKAETPAVLEARQEAVSVPRNIPAEAAGRQPL